MALIEQQQTAPILARIRGYLAEALAIAKAAEICANDGYPEKALSISLDIEELLHASNHLLQATSILHRHSREDTAVEEGGVEP